MTAENFVYWLQGFFEIQGLDNSNCLLLGPDSIKTIKDHIALVLEKKTPNYAATSSGIPWSGGLPQTFC